MTERERFRKALLFERPDKIPLQPGHPRESTLAAWHRQGLPQDIDWNRYLHEVLSIPDERAEPVVGLGVSFKMMPTFEEKVLEHRDGHFVVQDWMGAITEISDRYDYTYIRSAKDFVTRKWHRFPVENQGDWEERIAWRYDVLAPGRFPLDFDARCRILQARNHPLTVSMNGPFWQLREWCGLENLCLLMMDDPGFVADMVDFWTEFVVQTLSVVLEGVVPDQVMVSEDMGYKLHSMISPSTTERFLLPTWERWGQLVKAAGCPIYSVDSDGYMAELLPLWLEAGFNCSFPVEVAAGNDIVAYRRQYGRRMAYTGGIDKRAIAAGGASMRAEVMRVVPPLLEEGGLIPGCDHGVPPDISWPDYVAYARLLAELTGWL